MYLILALLLAICLESMSSLDTGRDRPTPSADLSGRITDLFGEPLEGAVVRVFPFSTNIGEPRIERRASPVEATTNSKGDYSIAGLPPGSYTVTVELRGFRRFESCLVTIQPGINTMDFGLEVGVNIDVPIIRIEGLVRRADRSPITDATLTIISVFNRALTEQTRTDQKGRYKFAILAPGHYVLIASKSRFATAAKAIVVSKPREAHFTLRKMP